MSEPPFDAVKAHRWFAIECNNRAWDLVEADERSAAQLEEMIHLAHTAWYHWQKAGNELNSLRADVLLATAHSVANRSENALIYAVSAVARLQTTEEVTPFDHTSAWGALALAYRLMGQTSKSQESADQFQLELAQIEDSDEQALLRRLYPL